MEQKMLEWWIIGPLQRNREYQNLFRALGMKIKQTGFITPEYGLKSQSVEYRVRATEGQIYRLDPYWGELIWGPTEKTCKVLDIANT